MMKLKSYLLACICIMYAGNSYSQTLSIGDDAPEIIFSRWMKGDSIAKLEKGKIYVLDIWATWCVPCIAAMPHLSELQKKYKDQGVVFIGITSDDPWGNNFENASAFLKKKDTLAGYQFAWVPESKGQGKARDGNDLRGIFFHPWMRQVGSSDMPFTFIVDRNGKFAFIGEPEMIDTPLDQLVSSNFNLDKAKADYGESKKAKTDLYFLGKALNNNNLDSVYEMGNKLLTAYNSVSPKTFLSMASQINEKALVDTRIKGLALEAAKKSVILTRFNSPGNLDALATSYYMMGDLVNAIIAEKAAISNSEGGMKEAQLVNLKKYLDKLAIK